LLSHARIFSMNFPVLFSLLCNASRIQAVELAESLLSNQISQLLSIMR
jgi:hypothetical protein